VTNLGPGVPANTSVTPIPTLVFTPTPSVPATCRFYNSGSSVVYIGGANVSPVNGFPILPGNRPVELQNVNVNLYACSGVAQVNTSGHATLSALNAAGSTTFTVATAAPTASTYVQLGSGTSLEYLFVSSFTGSGTPWTVTTSTASLYDHISGSTMATVVATPNPLNVSAGVA
jgi:hypothetical protein